MVFALSLKKKGWNEAGSAFFTRRRKERANIVPVTSRDISSETNLLQTTSCSLRGKSSGSVTATYLKLAASPSAAPHRTDKAQTHPPSPPPQGVNFRPADSGFPASSHHRHPSPSHGTPRGASPASGNSQGADSRPASADSHSPPPIHPYQALVRLRSRQLAQRTLQQHLNRARIQQLFNLGIHRLIIIISHTHPSPRS